MKKKKMELVAVESPFAGEVELNIKYARRCVMDCLRRGEAPYASHLFFTQEGLLDDTVPDERTLGIMAGKAWEECAKKSAVYVDRGVSSGMELGVKLARAAGRKVVRRRFGNNWMESNHLAEEDDYNEQGRPDKI